jgi:hypothetical protein
MKCSHCEVESFVFFRHLTRASLISLGDRGLRHGAVELKFRMEVEDIGDAVGLEDVIAALHGLAPASYVLSMSKRLARAACRSP